MTAVDRREAGDSTDEGDALAERARDVASAGLVIFPVVTHLYSVALLLRLRGGDVPVSYKGRKAAREAWRLDLAILSAAALCLGIMVAAWLALR
jgi:hypothetical protein